MSGFEPYMPPRHRDAAARRAEDAAEARYRETHRCRHRSAEAVQEVSCRGCGVTVMLPAYRCELHDCLATEQTRAKDRSVRWCFGGCDDHEVG